MVYHIRTVIIMATMSGLALHGAQRDSIDENDPRLWRELRVLSGGSGENDDEAYQGPLRVLEGLERTVSRDTQAINVRDPLNAKRGSSSSQFGLGDLEDPEPDCCKNMRAHCRVLRKYATCIVLVAAAGFSLVVWKVMDPNF